MTASLRKHSTFALCMLLSACLLLSGCTANVSSTDENGLLPHLTVDLQVPELIEAGQNAMFTILVQENGQPYEDAEHVEFEIWPVDHRQDGVTVTGEQVAPGTYTASSIIAEEGLYMIQCRIISEEYAVMPAKHFAIGEAAVHQLLELQEQAKAGVSVGNSSGSGGHHH
ncbi:hypothetical protein DUZ99_18700 [Xylanibacillus composti]|uniref:YtkA-like domain-containing protein n=1 Tax=Xylanibacillus composti TaxID=1572762 RepID=A0A8J4M2D7_9BACL|nr:FixH family protein [Xylanibacillus composti]MDT9726999.1 hypothetical protein [Xylanibacillus composti]GIQ69559.1 hypothetical protein XYCOK13_23830 [Xylanibacillus composti]